MIHRQTIVGLYEREGEKMAKIFKISVLSTICDKGGRLEDMIERAIDFLNRILTKPCLSTLKVAKDRRIMIDGKKLRTRPFKLMQRYHSILF
jgi:hypothetical protein